MARQVVVEITGDASGFQRATATATESAGKFQGLFNGIATGIGIQALQFATTAVQDLVTQILASDKIFQDDERSIVAMHQALVDIGSAFADNTTLIEEYVAGQQKYGQTAAQVRDSLSQNLTLTKNLTDAEAMNSAALDLAAMKHIPLAEAVDIVTKAYNGKTRGLASHGIVLDAHITQMAAVDAITKQVKGSADALADTSQGKVAASQAKMTAAWVQIGSVVDRVSLVVIPALALALTNAVDIISLVVKIGSHFQGTFQAIGNVLGGAVKIALAVVVTEFKLVVGIITTVINIVNQTITVFTNLKNTVSAVWSGIAAVVKGSVNSVIDVINNLIRGADNAFSVMAKIPGAPHIYISPLPRMHAGGIVPGAAGSDVPVMLQAGEQVTPAGRGGDIHLHIGTFIGSGSDIDRLADMIAHRMRLAGAL